VQSTPIAAFHTMLSCLFNVTLLDRQFLNFYVVLHSMAIFSGHLYSMRRKSQSQHSTRGVQPTSVLLIGHSYIRRLGDYMRPVPGAGNLGFDVDHVTVHCFGQGGGSIRPRDPRRSVLNILSQALPTQTSVIFFHMGANDRRFRSRADCKCHNVFILLRVFCFFS
jgi:hypothetical protein